jgi:hypothetical protein
MAAALTVGVVMAVAALTVEVVMAAAVLEVVVATVVVLEVDSNRD